MKLTKSVYWGRQHPMLPLDQILADVPCMELPANVTGKTVDNGPRALAPDPT